MNDYSLEVREDAWEGLSRFVRYIVLQLLEHRSRVISNTHLSTPGFEDNSIPGDQFDLWWDDFLTHGFYDDNLAAEHAGEIDTDEARHAIESVMGSIHSRDISNIESDIAQLADVCVEMGIAIPAFYEVVESLIEQLSVRDVKLIYLAKPDESKIYIPELIVPAHKDLLRLVSQNPLLLYTISPYEFEEIVAEVFRHHGYNVELTKRTHDGGKDIIVISNKMKINLKFIIECKRYQKESKVSLEQVQRLLGVKLAESANKAILATTSTFTRDAIRFSRNFLWELELKDYNDIVSWIKSCDI
jgi:hypothetical protein